MISRQVILMLCFLNDSKHFVMVMNHSFYGLCQQIILSSPNFKNSLAYSELFGEGNKNDHVF